MTAILAAVDRVLALSRADACIVIAQQESRANIRWAGNTVTTNGVSEEISLSVISIFGRRVASVTRTYFPPEHLEAMVRESEAACEGRPEAADALPLPDAGGGAADWAAPPAETDIRVFDPFVPGLAAMFGRARQEGIETFGYAEHAASTLWLATSAGARLRHDERLGKVEVTAKTPDFSRSSWAGAVTTDFQDVSATALFDRLCERLAWSRTTLALPAGTYEVLLEPSAAADLAISAYALMARRDADEGRSPFSSPGGARIGQRLFGMVNLYSDPEEPGARAVPFQATVESSSSTSVFDNGLAARRTDWVRAGVLERLVTPRYWAATCGGDAVPVIDNLILSGGTEDVTLDEMIARTERALLITCFWYIRTVDPQTGLETGLTRDGVFLIEQGRVVGAVNNFRWNMSPIVALAQAVEIGRTGPALPREHDEFLRAKAPALRIERFHMSSVSEAT